MMLLSPRSLNPPKLLYPSPSPHKPTFLKTITSKINTSRTQPQNQNQNQNQNLYQPFRPPPSPLPPKFRSLDTPSKLDILTNRLGIWYEYAPLIPSLVSEGFTPSMIEEITGISGVEQNRLVVAAKVRETLVGTVKEDEGNGGGFWRFFDNGGAELLYEIRLLSAGQRVEAARFLVEKKLDGMGAQEVARAMKDFPRRRGEKGWESFDYNLPSDCLSFMFYRQALEHKTGSEDRINALKQALEVAGSEEARVRVLLDLEGKPGDGKGEIGAEKDVKVPVVRMKVGEVAEATSVAVFPVCRGEEREREVAAAPWECGGGGEFGVVTAEKEWSRWVVLPGWDPVVGLKRGGVVVEFSDARVLPWKVNRWYKEEPVLVVVNRGRNEVENDEGFYLVVENGEKGELKVERGSDLKEKRVKEILGMVVLVVRPPRDENDDQLAEEDWE